MSESSSSANVAINSFLDALEEVRPEFAQLSQEELLPITLDPVTAAVTMRGSLPKIKSLRTQLENLATFDVHALEKLELYLHAWLRANALFLGSALPPEGFSALVAKVSAFRDNLASDAQALVQRGVIGAESLTGLKGAIGHKNIVSDVLTLTTLFRSNWQKISGRTCVTLAELDEADVALDALITDLGLREQTPASKEATALERQQSYTLFVSTYDQVRRAVSFVRWNEGDADEFAPSLFGGKKRKAGTDTEQKPPAATTTTPPTTTTITVPTSAVVAGAATTVARAGIGLPGSDPFTS